MVAPIKFLSGRQQQQKIGVLDSTENIKVLEVVGRAGIGTTIFEPTKQLDVRGDVFVSGELTVGDTTFGEDFSITDLTVSGVSTFTGISTFANNIIANSGLTVEGISTLNNNVNVQGILDVTGHTELDNLNVAGLSTLTGNVSFGSSAFFGDDDKINMGDGDDLQIYHDGVTGNIHNDTGTLILQSGNVRIQDAGSSETAFSAADGVAKLYFENSEKLTTNARGIDVTGHTETDTLNVSGVSTFTGDVSFGSTATFGDDDKIILGDGGFELQVYHSGTNSVIRDNGPGNLVLASNGDAVKISKNLNQEDLAIFNTDGSVELFYDNSKKFETTGIGVSVLNGTSDTATITAPTNLVLDPAAVGDNTGVVRIKGDLFVDGTQTQINSTTIELADFVVGIATTATTDLLTDGAGIGIGTNKFFTFDNTNTAFKSTENLNLETGHTYKINGTDVLSSDTLGSGVVNSSLTNLGTLTALDVNGHSELDNVNVSAASTFGGLVDINNGVQANTLKVEDLTENRVVIAGTSGELEDDANFTFDGSQLALGVGLTVTGIATFAGNIDANGGLDVDGLSDLDELNVTGLSTFGSNVDINAGLDVSGVSTFQGNVNLGDNDRLRLGDGADLQIYHDGNHSWVRDLGTGRLIITTDGTAIDFKSNSSSEFMARFLQDDAVELYYDNSKKFETTDGGIDVTGHTETDTLRVSGITTLGVTTATNLTSQQLNVSGISTLGVTTATDLTSQQLNVSGISTLGVTTATDLTSQQLNVSGLSTFTGAVSFGSTISLGDDDSLDFGGNTDFKIYYDSNLDVSILKTRTSGQSIYALCEDFSIYDRAGNTEAANFTTSDGCRLNHNTSTKLKTSTDGIQVTGIVTASSSSGIVTYYGDGTNLTLTDSVALGDDTTGNYVESISGTANQITVTGGTGEGSTPVISIPNNPTLPGTTVTIENDLEVNRNLNVTGNITVGGTSGTLFTETLKVADADLILGIRTDANGVDISTDTTANHGGIAVASTEGTPLVTIVNPGAGETLPATYKKIMWFESGSFSGLGTDAWLINYGVGIGSTQVPNNVVLAAGDVHVTNNDIKKVRDINASGIITASTLVSDVSEGTSPLTVTSTTLVSNLNADKLDGQEGAYYLNYNNFTNNPSIPTVNDGVLTLATSGDGISGSDTFSANQATDTTFTVTISSASTSEVNTLVYRDANGGFSAGIITAQDFNSTSDENLKININTIEDPLAKVVQIRGVNFEWKENNKPSAGVVAQEIERVLPHLVSEGDIKTVNYNGLIGLLIETVKEQQKQIDSLNNRLSKLE